MPKEFITERDIEDMARRGEMQLALGDDVVLTDLAYEKAQRLGVTLLRQDLQPPAAPIRPYLSNVPPTSTPINASIDLGHLTASFPVSGTTGTLSDGGLKKRVIEAVKNRLGGQVDEALLTTIVERVFADLGVR